MAVEFCMHHVAAKLQYPNQLAHYCTFADFRDTLSNAIQANL